MNNVLDVGVSYFKDYFDTTPKRVNLYAELLSWRTFNLEIDRLRNAPNEELRVHIKKNLPCITPSGTFTARNNEGLKKHSKLICIDIDAKDNPDITDWEAYKARVSKSRYVAYAALSVSGHGLFLLIPIRYPKRHQEHFEAIRDYLAQRGCCIDSVCPNVSRLRGCTYDPQPYINPEAKPYRKYVETESGANSSANPLVTNRNVEALIVKIEETGTGITADYKDWLKVGFALVAESGEGGRDYFHRLSRQNPGQYNYRECNVQYTKCLTSDRITIATFFHRCKVCGITLK